MSEQQEYVDPELISGAIARAQRGLENFTADAEGQRRLNRCRMDIQQVHDALPAQSSARSLTRAMLPVLDSLMANPQEASHEHSKKQQAKLIAALKQLPHSIVSGTDSQLPTLLKELRQLQKGPQKNWRMPGLITSGLMPDYLQPATDTTPIDSSQLEVLQDSGFAVTVRKIRQKYQLCLAGVIRDSQRQQQLQIIDKLFAKLQNLCWDSPLSSLWEVCSAFCQALQAGDIHLDNDAIRLLGDIDHELRHLVDEETARLNNPPPQKLFAQISQRIQEAHSDNPLILAIQQRYAQHAVQEESPPLEGEKSHTFALHRAPANKSSSNSSENVCPQSTYEIFAAQTSEIKQQLTIELPKWRNDFTDLVAASRIRRACHSLKGHGRIIGADVISELAWSLENMLDSVINGITTASEPMVNLLAEVVTMLPELVHDFVDNSQQLTPEVLMCMEKADALAAGDHYAVDDEPEDMADLQDSPRMFGHVMVVPAQDCDAEATAQIPNQPETDQLHWLTNATDHLSQWLDHISSAGLQQCQQELKTVVENARNLEQHELAQLGDVLLDICVYLETYEGTLPAQLLAPLNNGFSTLLAMLNQEEQPSPQGVFGALCDALELLLLGQPVHATHIPESVPQYVAVEAQDPLANITLPDYLGQTNARTPVTQQVDKPTADTPQELPPSARTAPAHELIQISTQRLETLINIAEESSSNRTCIEQQLTETVQAIAEMNQTVVRLREQFRRLDCQIQSRPENRENPQLSPLSNALAESTSDLMELHGILQQKTRAAEILLQQQARTQTELHEHLLKTRMVPFNQLVPRLRTFVHRICTELDKSVELLVRGGEEELDKTTLEQVLPTLEHLLRNAIDHGIEDSADVRRKAGKPAEGQISLTIHRDGMAVVVALADDGRGINLGAVQARAAAQQLISSQESVDMTRAVKLIMQPGFNSSANTASLAAIDLEIRQLGGSVALHSEAGQGTHITLRLPFAQSIHRALMVSVGGNHYALPMHTIDEITMVAASELSESCETQTVNANGTQYQLVHLSALLGNVRTKAARGQRPVVLVRWDNDHIAIEVDTVEGSREIISKRLGAPFSGLTGVTGVTIAGDGHVVIILDPLALYHKHLVTPPTPHQPDSSDLAVQVMVVDDSITARKTISQLLVQQGYQVIAARDGREALAMLAEQQPNIVLVDVEMPHMDGFGLLRALHDDPALAHLPVIMMAGESHRKQALELGVSELVAKPFREKRLLSAIESLTERVSS